MNPSDPITDLRRSLTRRAFFGRSAAGIGSLALGGLLGRDTKSDA